VIHETEIIIKSYLIGLLIQIAYITILLGGILLVIGIKHAILIGAIFAILNLIPYVGALVGNIIGVLLTLSSSQHLWPIFAVLITIAFVQGMFLSLPVIAVLKIIFDRTENMKQWGVLLGDERPVKSPMQFPVFRRKTRAVQKKIQEQNDIESVDEKKDR
jgi:predicted PurR-regulated permease PerM